MTNISMKEKRQDGSWGAVPGMAGLTIRQMFAVADGKEIVAEVQLKGKVYYFCGTDAWKKKMHKSKGNAVTFAEGAELVNVVNPAWLDEIPVLPVMAEVFGDVEFMQVELFEGDDNEGK